MKEILEKLKNLSEEQKKELNALKTAEEVSAFAKRVGVELSADEAAKIAAALPDDALDGVAGGMMPNYSNTANPRTNRRQ